MDINNDYNVLIVSEFILIWLLTKRLNIKKIRKR